MNTVLRCAILAVVTLGTLALGAEKRPTGRVEGDVYIDALTGLRFDVYETWKVGKIDNEDPAKPRLTRCILTQRHFAYPSEWQGNEEKFTPPNLGLFVDTSDMVLEAYAAELADRKSKRPSRKELMKDFPILGKGAFIEEAPTVIDGRKAIVQHYRQAYEVDLYQRITNTYKLIEEVLLGDVYLVKVGRQMFVFHFTSERAIYRSSLEEAKAIIMSADFDPPTDSAESVTPQ